MANSGRDYATFYTQVNTNNVYFSVGLTLTVILVWEVGGGYVPLLKIDSNSLVFKNKCNFLIASLPCADTETDLALTPFRSSHFNSTINSIQIATIR